MSPAIVPMPPAARVGRHVAYDAIVVGSGIGGCVAAATLADAGLRVLVIERNDRLGGILASRVRDGFKMDMGSHLVANGARGPIGAILSRLGLDRPRLLTHAIPVRSRGLFETTAPEHRAGLGAVGLSMLHDMHVPPKDALRAVQLLLEILLQDEQGFARLDEVSLHDELLRYIEHPGLYFLVSFLASIFYVLPPWELSAGEAMRGLKSVLGAYALSYVEGGMDTLPHALLGIVARAGGDIVTETRVSSVHRLRDDLAVVTDGDHVYRAPSVVLNAAPKVALTLSEDLSLDEAYRARVESLVPSGAAHQLRVALDRPLLEEGCMIGAISRNGLRLGDLSLDAAVDLVEGIRAGRIVDPLAFYAPVPTNYDPSLAPPGRQLLIASIYGAPGAPASAWRAAGLEALASVIPGFDEHVIFAEVAAVPAIGRWMGRPEAAAISTGQTPAQVGRRRLGVSTPVPGLFLAGDGAGGRGIGLELAATSGAEAAAQVIERHTRRAGARRLPAEVSS